MNSRRVLAVVVLLALLGSATANGDESPLAQNAALQYWKAFALLPEISKEQDDAVRKALEEDGTIDQSLTKLIADSQSALHELRKGAAMDECCWGVSLDEDMNAALPHLSKALQIARVACLRAETSFARGDASDAVEDIVAVVTLGRHTGKDALLIALLVDYIVERMAINTIAANLPSLDREQLRALAERLESLPSQPTAVDSIRAEKDLYAIWSVRILSAPDGKEQFLAVFGAAEGRADACEAIRKHSREELLAAAKDVEKFYDRLAELVAKSPAEVMQAEKQLMAEPGIEGVGREMAFGFVPTIVFSRIREAEYQTQLALIKAAIAVELDGPEALEDDAHRDPFGSGPFAYTKTANGFELRSTFVNREDDPVSLIVGRP